MTSRPGDLSAAPREAIFEQLDRILSSAPFQTSERSSTLLRFLVEQSVSGRPDRLKEYEIGTEALGKGSAFDPRTDPIVRSEVSRLRTRLEKYYATTGQTDPLIIELPKGGYLPQIQARSPEATQNADAPKRRVSGVGRFGWIAAGLVVVGLVIAAGLWTQTPRPRAPANVSIAVLPFANLSGDASQEFFSDGMTEEVTAALVKVPSLRVVARTSAFQFKGQGQDIRTVGRSLGATHLIEGSVRRVGNRLRISAQLIEADSGTHLWTENYDREFNDMFAIQDDIAQAIAVALRIPLGLPDEDLTRIGDLETYQTFLRARAMVHARGYGTLMEGVALLEQVVATNPGYAPAWAYLAQGYLFALNYDPAWISGDFEVLRPIVAVTLPKMETAARRAIELDPNLADGYAMLALARDTSGELLEAEDLYKKALSLDPNNPDVLHLFSRLLGEVGQLKDALAMRRQLQALEPFVPIYNSVTAWLLWADGQTDAAITLHQPLDPFIRGYGLPMLLATAGRYGEAADVLSTLPPTTLLPGVLENAVRLLRMAPTNVPSPETLPRLGLFNFIYAHVGAPERVLEFYEGGVDAGYSVASVNLFLWHPSYSPLRKTDRFKALMRDAGSVAYWRERGWPPSCKSIGTDDFICE